MFDPYKTARHVHLFSKRLLASPFTTTCLHYCNILFAVLYAKGLNNAIIERLKEEDEDEFKVK